MEEDRADSLEAKDLRSRVMELEETLRQRDDEIYYMNDEIHDLQNQNEDMKERLERYQELAGPLPPTAEAMQAMETSNDRAMRQIYGREGAKKLKDLLREPAARQRARKTTKATTKSSTPTIAGPSTSSSSSRGLGDSIRKGEGLKRKGRVDEAPPAKRRPGRPSGSRTGGGAAEPLASEAAVEMDNSDHGKKVVITIDSDSE